MPPFGDTQLAVFFERLPFEVRLIVYREVTKTWNGLWLESEATDDHSPTVPYRWRLCGVDIILHGRRTRELAPLHAFRRLRHDLQPLFGRCIHLQLRRGGGGLRDAAALRIAGLSPYASYIPVVTVDTERYTAAARVDLSLFPALQVIHLVEVDPVLPTPLIFTAATPFERDCYPSFAFDDIHAFQELFHVIDSPDGGGEQTWISSIGGRFPTAQIYLEVEVEVFNADSANDEDIELPVVGGYTAPTTRQDAK